MNAAPHSATPQPGAASTALVLTAKQLRDIVQNLISDDDDGDQEFTIQYIGNGASGPGLYVWMTDYPTEGAFPLFDVHTSHRTPPSIVPAAAAMRDQLLAALVQGTPEPGQVCAPAFLRLPYAGAPSHHTVDLGQLSSDCAAAVLAACMPANTASTSELLTGLNRLLAIARAERKRSYVVIASATSAAGACAAMSDANRLSNSSVSSFTLFKGGLSAVVVADLHPTLTPQSHNPIPQAQRGQASIANAAIIMAMAWALAILGPVVLDGAPDGDATPTYASYGYTPAVLEEGQAALLEAQARAACARGAHGAEGGYVALADGAVMCTDKRGGNAHPVSDTAQGGL